MKPRLILTALAVAGVCAGVTARSETQSRTVYMTVIDKKGSPVGDVSAAEVEVTEGGKRQAPVKVARATAPLYVAIIVDDRGLGLPEVRENLSAFVSALAGRGTIGLFSTNRPEWTVVDFTRDLQRLKTGIQTLVPAQASGTGLEPLTYDLARHVAERAPVRPILLTVTVDQDCVNRTAAERTFSDLTKFSVAQFADGCSPSLVTTDGRIMTQPATAAPFGAIWPQTVAQVQRSQATYYAIVARHTNPGDHDPIIDTSAEVTGGRVDPVLTESGIAAATRRIANEILGQYEVTYNAAPVPKDGAKLRIDVTRPGVVVRAPDRVGLR